MFRDCFGLLFLVYAPKSRKINTIAGDRVESSGGKARYDILPMPISAWWCFPAVLIDGSVRGGWVCWRPYAVLLQ